MVRVVVAVAGGYLKSAGSVGSGTRKRFVPTVRSGALGAAERRAAFGGSGRLVWNGQKPGEWRGGQMGELSSDEAGHGDEVVDAAIAACRARAS